MVNEKREEIFGKCTLWHSQIFLVKLFACQKGFMEEDFSPQWAVPQLLLTPKILLLFGFKALFAFLFLPILDCWTASQIEKIKNEWSGAFKLMRKYYENEVFKSFKIECG